MYVGETISINDLNDAEIICLCETMEDAKDWIPGRRGKEKTETDSSMYSEYYSLYYSR